MNYQAAMNPASLPPKLFAENYGNVPIYPGADFHPPVPGQTGRAPDGMRR